MGYTHYSNPETRGFPIPYGSTLPIKPGGANMGKEKVQEHDCGKSYLTLLFQVQNRVPEQIAAKYDRFVKQCKRQGWNDQGKCALNCQGMQEKVCHVPIKDTKEYRVLSNK